MMKREYDIFVDSLDELAQGDEIAITIRDLTPGRCKYDSRYVKAMVSSSPEQLPGADTLWIRFQRGQKHPQPWAIKIIEELGEYQALPME